jgi:hypothetical protein
MAVDSSGGFWLNDYSGNRILNYNSVPTTFGVLPNLILGQPDSHTVSFNSGTTVGASGLSSPSSVSVDSSHVAVSDYGNRRVILYDRAGLSTGNSASVVVAEPNFTSVDALYTYGSSDPRVIYLPYAVALGGGKLFVADLYCNKVSVWNTIPTSNFVAADIAIGQPNFATCAANSGGSPTASTLSAPYGVKVQGGKLFVADTGNNRVLVWNTLPTASGQAADLVIGQDTFVANSANKGLSTASASSLNGPMDVTYDGTTLAIADQGNHRVLIFDTFPTSNGASASRVLGQTNLTSKSAPLGPSDSSLLSPNKVEIYQGNLLISDAFYRVLGKKLSSIP